MTRIPIAIKPKNPLIDKIYGFLLSFPMGSYLNMSMVISHLYLPTTNNQQLTTSNILILPVLSVLHQMLHLYFNSELLFKMFSQAICRKYAAVLASYASKANHKTVKISL